ncbi:MAG: Holliday junction resolvase YqgF [Firmicutes bacterium]|nr:Holliday junction resolvase YqgF [Bacillota bacterium]
MNDEIIAVDPGRQKCGVAVVGRGGVVVKMVVETVSLGGVVSELAEQYKIRTVVVGNRTSHNAAVKIIEGVEINGGPPTIELVDEHRSTDEARGRYWIDHPPRGLARLWPVTLRVPPVPVDDYVAVILAERYFAKNNIKRQ